MNNNIFDYIRENFSVTASHLRTLEEVYRYLEGDCYSLETCGSDDRYLVPCFWYDFLKICDAGDIDLTEEELLKHGDGAVLRSEYYGGAS